MKRVGIDIGSLYTGAVIIEDTDIVKSMYKEHKGDPASVLSSFISEAAAGGFDSAGMTGGITGAGGLVFDSVLSIVEGIRYLKPDCRNAIAVGGESFSIIFFDEQGKYREHSVNPPCAAGTGSFIEQQAERLSLPVASLAERAASYEGKTPVIATRCAVFAKTDIIHAMQEGYSLDAVCAGLSEGIARNILDTLVKGRTLHGPIVITGGVSLNKKIINTIREMTGKEVFVPARGELAGAIGAALLGTEKSLSLEDVLKQRENKRRTRRPLQMLLTRYPDFDAFNITNEDDVEVFLPGSRLDHPGEVYLGIDIGSTSTKAVVLTPGKEPIGGFYTATAGAPIAAVSKIMGSIDRVFKTSGGLAILGVCTTGSGRKMIKELFSADLDINEITAHARAAVFLEPGADTIIEIGGQDSKFTRIRDGEVYFSTMNYVCAAGTGSFIEEQAKRLGVGLSEFSEMALGAQAPFTSDRCTVYMERDLSELLREGWSREALAASVLNSVRDNFMAKVVNKSPLGDFVVFQGATARNRALVAAFEQLLERPIHVSPWCHLTGALGSALLCLEAANTERADEPTYSSRSGKSSFSLGGENFRITEEVCDRCVNRCLLTVVSRGETVTGWGMKCGKDYNERSGKTEIPSAAEKRFAAAFSPMLSRKPVSGERSKITIGIPHALYNTIYAPLWNEFLSSLGFSTFLTKPSRVSIAGGREIVNSDFCAPMVAAHGYIRQLLESDADFIFYPAMLNEENPGYEGELLYKKKTQDAYFCYYSQYLPVIVSKLTAIRTEDKLISPLLSFNERTPEETARDIHAELSTKIPGISEEETITAFLKSLAEYQRLRSSWPNQARFAGSWAGASPVGFGSDAGGGAVRIVMLGRPYVAFDKTLNLGIPRKLEESGADVFWMDELALESFTPEYGNKYLERMHWHYGRTIIKAAEFCAREENLFAVYLTCFRCSPDSFLISYVKDIMTRYGKPFLILQLDEHGSDVGYATRIEAGMKSFENYRQKQRRDATAGTKAGSPGTAGGMKTFARNDVLAEGDTVLIPGLDGLISGFWADCFRRAGYKALVLPPDEQSLNTGYQYANGGECMPLVSLVGSAVETVQKERLDPRKTFFYIPTLCMACNFPQFPILSDLVFGAAGLKGLKIGLINTMSPGEILPQSLSIKILESNIVGGILYKLFFRIKPYEKNAGAADAALRTAEKTISEMILSGADLKEGLKEAVRLFESIVRDERGGRKPRIGLIGDLYVKFNDAVNQRILDLTHELGGELVVPSLTEYPFHFYDADIRFHNDDSRSFRLLKTIEKRYEKIAEGLIPDQAEPDFEECVMLMKEYGIRHYIAGETSINVGRALYYIKHKAVEAILHINPMFCCPGVVSASIYRKIQEDFGVPIIDIFYDGTGNPNRVLVPHMHYLKTNGTC